MSVLKNSFGESDTKFSVVTTVPLPANTPV